MTEIKMTREEMIAKRGPGRPTRGRGTQHIEATITLDVIEFLASEKERNPKFSKSAYIDQAVREKMAREK